MSISRLVTDVSKNETRNHIILEQIKGLVRNKSSRVLILSDRLDQLDKLHKDLGSIGMKFTGKTSREADLKKARIIFATYGIASEGLDVSDLNCLVLATPRRSIEQSVWKNTKEPYGY